MESDAVRTKNWVNVGAHAKEEADIPVFLSH